MLNNYNPYFCLVFLVITLLQHGCARVDAPIPFCNQVSYAGQAYKVLRREGSSGMLIQTPRGWADSIEPLPAIIFVHGGGLIGRANIFGMRQDMQAALDAGYIAIGINYRDVSNLFTPDDELGASMLEGSDDVACAVRWLKTNASQWKIDPQRLGVLAHSQGGTVANALLLDYDAQVLTDQQRMNMLFGEQKTTLSEIEQNRLNVSKGIRELYRGEAGEIDSRVATVVMSNTAIDWIAQASFGYQQLSANSASDYIRDTGIYEEPRSYANLGSFRPDRWLEDQTLTCNQLRNEFSLPESNWYELSYRASISMFSDQPLFLMSDTNPLNHCTVVPNIELQQAVLAFNTPYQLRYGNQSYINSLSAAPVLFISSGQDEMFGGFASAVAYRHYTAANRQVRDAMVRLLDANHWYGGGDSESFRAIFMAHFEQVLKNGQQVPIPKIDYCSATHSPCVQMYAY